MSVSLPGLPVKVTVVSADTKKTGIALTEDVAGKKIPLFMPYFFGGSFAPYPQKGDTLQIQCDRADGRVLEAWH